MRRSALVVSLVALGCSDAAAPALGVPASDTARGESTTHEPASTTESDVSGTANDLGPTGPPIVLDIGKSATTLGQDESIVVTATVRDPDGDHDIASGWLVLGDADLEVAPFSRGVNGRYSAPLSWADLVRLDPPSFEGSAPLRLVGRFTDASGLTAEGETTVLLVCFALSGAACDGECVDLEAHDDHCGACGHACEITRSPAPSGGCDHGRCAPTYSPCTPGTRFADCAAVCGAESRACTGDCEWGYLAFADEACATDPLPSWSGGCDPEPLDWPTTGAVTCCCGSPR